MKIAGDVMGGHNASVRVFQGERWGTNRRVAFDLIKKGEFAAVFNAGNSVGTRAVENLTLTRLLYPDFLRSHVFSRV